MKTGDQIIASRLGRGAVRICDSWIRDGRDCCQCASLAHSESQIQTASRS